MDYFEALVQTLLELEGYWVRQSFKVNLTKEEKRQTGKPSIPRPEIDLLALNFRRNEVLALEVKSLLDSPGVKLTDLKKIHPCAEGRYKLFTCQSYRSVVLKRLAEDLTSCGMADKSTKFILGLAAGRVYQKQSEAVHEFMQSKNWLFWSPEEIKAKVTALAERRYENNPAVLTAKILLR